MTSNDKSIKITAGNISGVVNTGKDNIISQITVENKKNISEEITEILEQLAESYPDASVDQKQMVLQMEIQKKLKSDPTFKKRFISAAKSGGLELIKVVTNNPFVSVPLEVMRGWVETQ